MIHTIVAKTAILTIAAQIGFGANAVASDAMPNLRDANPQPDVVRTVPPFGSASLGRNCRRFSDFHVYSPGGKPFRQRRDHAGLYWVDSDGFAVAGLDRVNCDMISFRSRPIKAAAWKEDTRN